MFDSPHQLQVRRQVTYYKIRNKDGLYSTGTAHPVYTKGGKVWKTKAHLYSHLRALSDLMAYRDCVIVEYEVQESGTQSVQPIVAILDREGRERQAQKEAAHRKALESFERAQAAHLLHKYPDLKDH